MERQDGMGGDIQPQPTTLSWYNIKLAIWPLCASLSPYLTNRNKTPSSGLLEGKGVRSEQITTSEGFWKVLECPNLVPTASLTNIYWGPMCSRHCVWC